MKKMNKLLVIAVLFAAFSLPFGDGWGGAVFSQNVGINELNPDSSALLELTSTERGLIIPRMTTAQRDSIDLTGNPNSVLIFNTTTECFEAYNANTSTWVAGFCIGCTVPTAVTASASPNPICAGDTLTLTGDATDATGWSWSGPNSFSSTSQSPTIADITTAGAGVYTLAASNNCGSVNASTDSVIVNTNPTATASNNGPVCEGDTLSLTGGPDGMSSYSWSGPNSYSSSTQSPTVSSSATTAMDGVYTLTVTDANGCTDTEQTTVTVNTTPTATASNNGPVCEGDTLSLTGGPVSMSSYSWSGPNSYSSSTQSPTVSSSATTAMDGVYTLTVTDANGCTDTEQTTVTIYTESTAATSASASPDSICNGGSSTLSVTGGSLSTDASWHWYSGSCGGTAVGTGASVSVSPAATTTYYVRAEGTCNTTSCVSVTVTVVTSPCGGISTVDDIEGNTYNTVELCTQCWLKENMRTTTYPDGSAITKGPIADNAAGWDDVTTAYYSCPPNAADDGEDCAAAASLGMLYQWNAAMHGSTAAGAQGICPDGWHVPTDDEWKTLEGYLGMSAAEQDADGWRGTNEGSKMADHVADQNWPANDLTGDPEFDASGFDVGPSGCRDTYGDYYGRGSFTYLLSSLESGGNAWIRHLNGALTQVHRATSDKPTGFSVRCVKD